MNAEGSHGVKRLPELNTFRVFKLFFIFMALMEIFIAITVCLVLIVALVALSVTLNKEKRSRVDAERKINKLKVELALMETEQLKFQLQPHTLKNILMNLKLIAKKLNQGMDALSETLDYILYKGNEKHLVSIEDEINFIKKYLKLNGLINIEIDALRIDDSALNKNSYYFTKPCIPHLITAHFIENAFKHGDVDHPEFLTISLSLTDKEFKILVINKIKNKTTVKENGGIGLTNMKRRLDLLVKDRYEVKFSCNETDYFSTLIIRFKG